MQLGAFITTAELTGLSGREDWSRWVDRGRAPAPPSLPGLTIDDLDLLKALGVREVAVTAEWARLQPTQHERAHLEIEAFRNLLEEMTARELRPWICLLDATQPGWFSDDEGGFADRRARTLLWPRYVDFVGELFGDLAHGWIPQREPIRRELRAELLGRAPSNRRGSDADPSARAGVAISDAMRAEAEAVRLLQGTAPIALSVTGRRFRPATDNVKAAPRAAWLGEVTDRIVERAVVDGELAVPGQPSVMVEALRDAYEAVLVHLRHPIEVDGAGNWSPADIPLEEAHDESLDVASSLAGQRTLIASADLDAVASTTDDVARSDGLGQTMALAHARGATAWWQASPLDGWHWERGTEATPGLVTINRELRPAADEFVRRSNLR